MTIARTTLIVAAVVVAGTSFLATHSSPSVDAALSSDSDLVADIGRVATRVGNQRMVADPPPPPAPAEPGPEAANEVVSIVNAERAAAGLAPVTVHPQLSEAALAHSRDQAARLQMSHTGSDNSNAGSRIDRTGYDWWTWGENVAMGYRTAPSVMDGWMGSDGHRRNILNGNFVHIGVAAVTGADGAPYWTMVLAAPR